MRTIHTILTQLNKQTEDLRLMKEKGRKQKNLSAKCTLVQTRKGGFRVE